MGEPTTVNEGARLSLMRLLATLEDHGRGDANWPEWVPLFEGDWSHSDEDMILAMREATALGHIESDPLHTKNDPASRIITNLRGGREYMLKLTPAGYAWIRARDLVGELEQDGHRV